jgi:hypothetical protein
MLPLGKPDPLGLDLGQDLDGLPDPGRPSLKATPTSSMGAAWRSRTLSASMLPISLDLGM